MPLLKNQLINHKSHKSLQKSPKNNPPTAKSQTSIYRKKTKDPIDLLPSSSNTDLPSIPTLPQFTPPPTTIVPTAPIGSDVMITNTPQPHANSRLLSFPQSNPLYLHLIYPVLL
ncbi:unnamed protein product [Brassica oleracea]